MIEPVFNAFPELIAAHGRQRPAAPALAADQGVWTWREFAQRIDAAAALLQEAGVQRGDRVALLAANRREAYVGALAALRIGAIAAPVSPLLTPAQIAAVFDDAAPSAILFDPDLRALFDAAYANTARQSAAIVAIDTLPAGEAVAPRPQASPLGPHDPATLIYSSGTTGAPKGILHDHHARITHAVGLAAEFAIGHNAVTLLATPLHTNGTWMMALPTLAMGGCCMLMSRFTADDAIRRLAEDGVTHMFAVPTMLAAMHQQLSVAPRAMPALVMCVSAGSALAPALKQAMHALLGGRLGELYGLTEGVATTLPPEEVLAHLESVGRASIGVEFILLDENGGEASPGAVGEIAGRSNGLMRGYYNRPNETHQMIWRDSRGRTFLRTGDMGRFDEDGYLHIVDRKKDMIVSGGLNVFSADLEAIVREHPAIADVAVIAATHPKWGEAPLAIVQLKHNVSPEAIADFANTRLAKHQRIARVVTRDRDFPRNLLGKVLKRELRAEYSQILIEPPS